MDGVSEVLETPVEWSFSVEELASFWTDLFAQFSSEEDVQKCRLLLGALDPFGMTMVEYIAALKAASHLNGRCVEYIHFFEGVHKRLSKSFLQMDVAKMLEGLEAKPCD